MSLARSLVLGLALTAMALVGCKKPAPPHAAQGPGAVVRLPGTVTPERYNIAVEPDVQNLTFKGHADITVDVRGDTQDVTLNAADLAFGRVALDNGQTAKVKLDPASEHATFSFPSAIAPGRHVLSIDYTGKIYQHSSGLFVLDYDTPQGKKRMMVSQFESADARRFVPSWDEPARKAVFQISVIAPADQMAVSNMPVASSDAAPNGMKKVTFQPTPKMSTYLMFLAVGDLERVSTSVDGVDVGVVVRRGAAEKARYALESARDLLHYYNGYFGTPYPLPKLDLIAAPGAGGFGAMENWGAILYFENTVLVDPKLSTENDKQYVFSVVAHETAHMWFGDLVTMNWWDDLWLNESFANWMENHAMEALHPEWHAWLRNFDSREKAFRLDAAASTHPVVQPAETMDQVNEIGDAITYDKGANVIRMLEAYVGEDAWRKGVQTYIRDHAYGNTTRADLWRAVEAAAPGKPIAGIARDFTEIAGVPLIQADPVSRPEKGAEIIVQEGRFGLDEASKLPQNWRVPVTARALSGGPILQAVVVTASTIPALQMPAPPPVIINYGQTGYYRTRYPDETFALLSAKFALLQPMDQMGLIADSLALGEAGYAPITRFLELASKLPVSADPIVWQRVVASLVEIDQVYRDLPTQAAYRQYAARVLTPVMARVGWDARPGEAAPVSVLREKLIEALGEFDDPATIQQANIRFQLFLANHDSLSAAIRTPVLDVVGRHADAKTFEQLRALARGAVDYQEKRQFLMAMGGVKDARLADRMLAMSITPEVPSSLAPQLIRQVAVEHMDAAWTFAVGHEAALKPRLDASQVLSFIPRLAGSAATKAAADRIHVYAPGGRREADKVEADVRFRANVRDNRLGDIDRWLQARTPVVAIAPPTPKPAPPARRGVRPKLKT